MYGLLHVAAALAVVWNWHWHRRHYQPHAQKPPRSKQQQQQAKHRNHYQPRERQHSHQHHQLVLVASLIGVAMRSMLNERAAAAFAANVASLPLAAGGHYDDDDGLRCRCRRRLTTMSALAVTRQRQPKQHCSHSDRSCSSSTSIVSEIAPALSQRRLVQPMRWRWDDDRHALTWWWWLTWQRWRHGSDVLSQWQRDSAVR